MLTSIKAHHFVDVTSVFFTMGKQRENFRYHQLNSEKIKKY